MHIHLQLLGEVGEVRIRRLQAVPMVTDQS
jgi:hypothetical protein